MRDKWLMEKFLQETVVAKSFEYSEETDNNNDNYIDPESYKEYTESHPRRKNISCEAAFAHKKLHSKKHYFLKFMLRNTFKYSER